jgi:hypothetical protein
VKLVFVQFDEDFHRVLLMKIDGWDVSEGTEQLRCSAQAPKPRQIRLTATQRENNPLMIQNRDFCVNSM